MADEIPYQNEPQVAQLRAERANAVIYGQQTLIDAADKVLATFGVSAEPETAASHRKAAAEDSDEESSSKSRSEPPAGRSAAKKSTTKQ